MDKRLKSGAIVKVKSTGCISILGDIQDVHNRYQLRNVSGWQYGIDDLEYLDKDAVLSELERIEQERVSLIRDRDYWYDNAHQERELSNGQKEYLRNQLEQVKKELHQMTENAKGWKEQYIAAWAERELARSELAAKDKVLQWYADKTNWIGITRCAAIVNVDGGEEARMVLAQYTEKGEQTVGK